MQEIHDNEDLKFRVKDNNRKLLKQKEFEANLVWNVANEYCRPAQVPSLAGFLHTELVN